MWRYPTLALPSLAPPPSALALHPLEGHAVNMHGEPPIEGHSEGQEQRRVYPPHEVQARLEVSASGLRRLAGIYERTIGPLPRDDRGRVWPEEAVHALEDARALVRESRAVSIEAALRGQEVGGEAEPYPATQKPSLDEINPGAVILEELRRLRELVEEQNRRISELEEAVRTGGRELEKNREHLAKVLDEGEVTQNFAEFNDSAPPVESKAQNETLKSEESTGPEAHEPGFWRRVAAWFGFGVRRP